MTAQQLPAVTHMGDAAPRQGPAGRGGPADEHLTMAALALGLAYSHLPDDEAIDHLTHSGDHRLLALARDQLGCFDHYTPETTARASLLLQAAITQRH
jgi:hypothetical protein